MKKYLVILPYFGPLPSYFKLFLDGCIRNPGIDFLFFTDQLTESFAPPPNFTIIRTTLSQLKNDFEKKLHHPISLEKPYKLCDFKPAYAFLFEEFLKGYDYWGFGDIDLIYGNLEGYLKKIEPQDYSVISFRERWISGSLAFFKNQPNINTLFTKANICKDIFTSSQYLGFDETLRRWKEYQNASSIEEVFPTDNSLTSLISMHPSMKAEKVLFERIAKEWIAPNEVLEVNRKQNSITPIGNDKNYPYYHFVCEKSQRYFVYPNWEEIPEKYYISRLGFFKKNSGIDYEIRRNSRLAFKYGIEYYRKLRSSLSK